ncbi:hypothetical protein BKA56DRAFT_706596 [Ilyonectria sp. MPI-CAGE-AT-0026]|nr:hypothetical protein BKA56DRAFT_706596 [Ilyonectria sp. MPI-CAGE-AT-0026]
MQPQHFTKLDYPTSTAQHGLTKPLEQSLTDMGSEISRLNKTSNTIRRAGKEAQTLKASDFQIKDDDGENVEPLLLHHFEHHVQDRFPEISENLRQRLARVMLLRRKRILYRRHRQGNTAIQMQKAAVKASITLPAAQKSEQGKQKPKEVESQVAAPAIAPSQIQSAITLAPNKFKLAASNPSVVSASKTIALGSRDSCLPTRSCLDLQAVGEITCSYCLYALPAREMFDEKKWHHHVKSDLDPYVCLFEDCEQEELLHNHADEWLSHMREHAKFWRCSSHRELGSLPTREAYITHMRQVHNSKRHSNAGLGQPK